MIRFKLISWVDVSALLVEFPYMKLIRIVLYLSIQFILIINITSCQVFQPSTADGPVEQQKVTPDLENLPPEYVFVQGQQIRQWAIEAVASSEYSDPEWSANQAVGPPNTNRCGDYQTAWATAGSDSKAWLEVKYPLAVHVTAVNVIQTFNPNQVVTVELIGPFDRSIEIYNLPTFQVDQPCPYTLPIPIEKTGGRFDTVRITIDQSELGLGWNQIDAVELVGEPD